MNAVFVLLFLATTLVAAQFEPAVPFTVDGKYPKKSEYNYNCSYFVACSKGLEDNGGIRCLAYIPRYFWDNEAQQCVLGIYGGCGATANNFEKLEDCVETARKFCVLWIDFTNK